jgi:hypothetical protein
LGQEETIKKIERYFLGLIKRKRELIGTLADPEI